MTDRELLELAAKAAGYHDDCIYPGHDGGLTLFEDDASTCGDGQQWNPLTDDGDALRLAIKLGFGFDISNGATWIKPIALVSETTAHLEIAPHSDDPYAATRRAIVRAAAEIGKAMK